MLLFSLMKGEKYMNSCMITEKIVKNMIERRKKEIHKGDCGRILVVSGSEGMMGAAILSCRGALRSGAGLVQLMIPRELFPVAQVAVPEATCLPRTFPADLSRYDAVALGPGLGTGKVSADGVKHILNSYTGPLVLDADGLNILASQRLFAMLQKREGETIITPHMGEAERILKSSAKSGDSFHYRSGTYEDRLAVAMALREVTGATVVLKGASTIVATLEGKTYINTTGNPGMATGGAGDVLTGMIAGFWGQKMSRGRMNAGEAAVCGVFFHGLAGDLAAETLGEYGLLAGDIADHIPSAIKRISG